MQIPDEQKDRVLEFLHTRLGSYHCPLCGSDVWHVADKIFELPEYKPDLSTGVRSSVPVIVLTCQECGYVQQISAIRLGVIAKTTESQQSEEEHEQPTS